MVGPVFNVYVYIYDDDYFYYDDDLEQTFSICISEPIRATLAQVLKLNP
jgi:hypothetical protein